jgi:hypothetical protein
MSGIKSLWITTRPPSGNDLGAVEAAFYTVADGVLSLCSEEGRPKTHKLEPGQDPRAVAGRMALEAYHATADAPGAFNRPLSYGRGGVA